MKKLFYLLIASVAFLLSVSTVSANYGCALYGGECPTASQIIVDKLIRDPRSKGETYVDNLLLSDYKFSPGEDIIFKIVIKNTGNKTIDNVKVFDTIPPVANYVLLSGEPRESIRELTRDLGSLGAGESKNWFIRMRVKPGSQVPAGTVCGDPHAINRVRVSANDMPDSQDTSAFCVQKTVMGVTTQPEAGSETLLIAAGLITLAGIGLIGKRALALS
ncbi:MAG: hypothetical protein UU81_C0005G0019 [Microgenomates group bacterium GW2011_GWC1_41_8]|uniref:DUF11 domain-containing protein n=3 Tax=Candidatus Roizmaniibacteriota TaxID=1752723 RepID=A0A0G0ZHB0_9BACT|nr:MAG: hypothetical protein UT85_C0026G0008 [Candidatus Levybacteria bacterium GW2011_GWA2_40_16]KKR71248.1 MAG: hypothetical protein UU14_C0032G0011 [Candidatus Roizmanbacteria bacterium GW2011_GWB1_40_7]KKR92770.1 MAG: hypothetical protein UU41_C0025G0008 [Candidatus Roizmanbacteria bacterium GW2011_GWA1_41_13]KKS21446.1 MAG: hypothetical protein UU78_C0038G0006 [Candidatus Roizmanbacteria bacterium GW2011_GWC2_41_7]KKS24561.1 MAG: hypothetical protein UU81_C0005G0019 [Microgenomates group b